ncbi:Txe/YoeB family addiction module toxin [Clostridia bacterium]|nr:Txe/YoeB family addiction module toxin [Clostridia bacterium]
MLRRINELLKDVRRDPFHGLGKPEPLKGNLAGAWSRRINDEHRMVYEISGGSVYILMLREHYK